MNTKVRNLILILAPIAIGLSTFSLGTADAGPPGVRGSQGSTGSVGATGPVGKEGPIGSVGTVGPRGRRGSTGDRGPTGLVGVRGPTGPAHFDSEFALVHAKRVVEDIGVLDVRSADGIGMSTRLSMLSSDFDGLASDGTPPGVDAAHYFAEVTTLGSFADKASTAYLVGDQINGLATYEVVRANTVPLLAELSKALGTPLALP